ncbi:hypothetical protein Gocc_0275 [Gaiella occulta]|uniref:Universal stress protein family n=1 Tax=Gaiella occulta TaxID=1002870 RepID=A0A7M2Z0C1_9ACTN|nr:hypothetical protein [Gaiella occulta]RDI75856.1 hypothetical protein Gocc_0275 [Gaiella occulta]
MNTHPVPDCPPSPREPLRRILLVATEVPGDLAFRARAYGLADGRASEVLVLCPPLVRFLQRWTSDVLPARAAATRTLERTLAAVRELGLDAHGRIGDDDPRQALDDALREFAADELVLVTGSDPRHRRLEQRLVRFAYRRVALPITHIRYRARTDADRDSGSKRPPGHDQAVIDRRVGTGRAPSEEPSRALVAARPHSSDEDRLVARVAWEHARGRSLAEILGDPVIRARCTDRNCFALLERPDLIRALARSHGSRRANPSHDSC